MWHVDAACRFLPTPHRVFMETWALMRAHNFMFPEPLTGKRFSPNQNKKASAEYYYCFSYQGMLHQSVS